jgi:hypothetical protein
MTLEEEVAWWKVVFLHEAGHAVASIVRYKEYHAISAQNDPEDQVVARKASYQHKTSLTDPAKRPEDFLIMVCGGAAAERLVLQQDSAGFLGDRAKLYSKLPIIPAAAQANMAAMADEEIAGQFPKTQDVLRRYRRALDAIADAAMKSIEAKGLVGREFKSLEVLTAADVERLFDENPPQDGDAQIAAEG